MSPIASRSCSSEAGGSKPQVVEAGNPLGAFGPLGLSPELQDDSELKVEVSRSDRWYMLYTSGTTGRPKGCQHSQGGYYVNVLSWLSQLHLTEKDCLLSLSPLFHVHGFATLLCALVAGAKVVIPPRGISAEDTLKLTAAEQVTFQPLWQNVEEILGLHAQLQLPLALRLIIAPEAPCPRNLSSN